MDGATIGAILAAGKNGGGVIASHARARQAAQDAQDARDKTRTATIPETLEFLGLPPLGTGTASGPVASFETDVHMPLKDWRVGIEPVQTGSGDPSSENVRPITGWTGMTLARTGASMLDGVTIESGYYDASGIKTASDAMLRTADLIPAVPGRTYMIRIVRTSYNTSSRLRVHEFDASGNWLRQIYVSGGLTVKTHTFWLTVSSDAAYIAFSYPIRNDEVRAEWDATTYDLSFGNVGTIYGGTLDVISGELTVDRIGVDMETLTWKTRATGSTMKSIYASLPEPYRGYPIDGSLSVTAECYTLVDFYAGSANDKIMQPDGKSIGLLYYSNASNPTGSTIYVRTTLDDEPAGLIVYTLATPLTYQITPLQVRTLIGQNNFLAETGETAITYYRKE